ncbi:type II secretion system F family protein [Chloroflexota bacterium]
MDFSYVAYGKDKKMVKGRLSATNQTAAARLLSYGGYRVLSIKPITSFINMERLSAIFTQVNPKEVTMFSRQLALLLESGTDIVASLELLQGQVVNRTLRRVIGEVVSDIRSGSPLSAALMKHPRVFPQMYSRTIAAGERGGNLEVVLRQMAEFIERRILTEKRIKSALTYPVIVAVVAVIVVALLVAFVLPTFTELYSSFGTEQPTMTAIFLNVSDWAINYGLYVLIGLVAVIIATMLYSRTPSGSYQIGKISLRLPVIGRILILSELSRACRTISLLFRVGLPLPDVLTMASQGTSNKVVSGALEEVRRELIRGQGLSKPMSQNSLFLPLMVQMAGVGEGTGNLDHTLSTVAESYEMEADDRTTAAVGLIQPIMTVAIGLVVGFIAVSLMSAMYSMYGQLG